MHLCDKQNLRYIKMTREQHENLKKYEQIFRTAIDSQYIRAMDSRFAADFINICHELNIYINTSCPACVLKAAQTLGKLYFDYKEEPENLIQEEQKQVDNKTIKPQKKVAQDEPKQPKKPIITRSKTNKK